MYEKVIECVRDTVMDTEALCGFVSDVYNSYGSYVETGRALGDNPMSIWRAVHTGADPSGVRKSLNIKKLNRTRICFEADELIINHVNYLCKEAELTRAELFIDMLIVYADNLERLS